MSFGLSYFENEFLTSMSSLYHVVKIADCLQTAAQVGIYYDFTAFYKKEGQHDFLPSFFLSAPMDLQTSLRLPEIFLIGQ